jgi:transcriptional regulator NrdR family protein
MSTISHVQSVVSTTRSTITATPHITSKHPRHRCTTTSLITAKNAALGDEFRGPCEAAYIRFASVYRDFKDVREFKEELEGLLESGKATKK